MISYPSLDGPGLLKFVTWSKTPSSKSIRPEGTHASLSLSRVSREPYRRGPESLTKWVPYTYTLQYHTKTNHMTVQRERVNSTSSADKGKASNGFSFIYLPPTVSVSRQISRPKGLCLKPCADNINVEVVLQLHQRPKQCHNVSLTLNTDKSLHAMIRNCTLPLLYTPQLKYTFPVPLQVSLILAL